MVGFTTVITVVAAALAGNAAAQSCQAGRKYCGATLLNGSNDAYWHNQMQTAQPGLDQGRRWDALWTCQSGNKLSYDDYCPRVNQLCQPNRSGKCSGLNDCCAA